MELKTETISIVGFGNVGTQLYRDFVKKGISISHLLTSSTSIEGLSEETKIITSLDDIPKEQLVLLCVPDHAIEGIVNLLNPTTPVAYTSGSFPLSALNNRENTGVFYPLQTFSKGRDIDIEEVPFFIEADTQFFESSLVELAKKLSSNVHLANSEQRKKLHLTAVWVNNFTNHILTHAKDYADREHVNFEHLKPLLKETIKKLDSLSPFDAQTGPARRDDDETIEAHLQELTGTQKELYALLSRSIKQNYTP